LQVESGSRRSRRGGGHTPYCLAEADHRLLGVESSVRAWASARTSRRVVAR
jgi:hypothetical protein